jgi:hypothetical protein
MQRRFRLEPSLLVVDPEIDERVEELRGPGWTPPRSSSDALYAFPASPPSHLWVIVVATLV